MLYNQGGRYSTICAARSALATCITVENVANLAEHMLIKRFVKGIFNRHPPTPKYTSIWDINIVLELFNNLPENRDMPFEQLTKKFVVLLLILSARRKHTLTCIHIDKVDISNERLIIMPTGNLKHSRQNKKEEPIVLNKFDENKKLCIVNCAQCYMERRGKLPLDTGKLIVTHKKPHRPASRDTISRWVKDVLSEAGVDTQTFAPHSCRSAATSKAKLHGIPIDEIMKRACWTRISTFSKFYDKDIVGTIEETKSSYERTLLQDFA